MCFCLPTPLPARCYASIGLLWNQRRPGGERVGHEMAQEDHEARIVELPGPKREGRQSMPKHAKATGAEAEDLWGEDGSGPSRAASKVIPTFIWAS